ncbi:MAG: DUF1961 family protein [Armatimonadota bacterium]
MRTLSIAAPLAVMLALVMGTLGAQSAPERPVIIVDNADADFTTTGDGWNPSTRDPGFQGDGYLWHAKGAGEAKAIWRAAIAKKGRYNVYARWVMSKPEDRATNAPFTIRSADGDTVVRVDLSQRQSAADRSPWNLLGTFAFEGQAQVMLSNDSDNSVVADAVKLEYMERLGAAVPKRGGLVVKDDCEKMRNWYIEGRENGRVAIVDGALRVTSTSDRKGVHAWFRPELPEHFRIEYDMTVHGPKGFALVFFCAKGTNNQDMITGLPARDGTFSQYVRNEALQCYHLSIHRMGTRSHVDGANLNKNPGKTLVQRHAVDPCPPAEGDQTYHITLIKAGGRIQLLVDDKLVLFYIDESPEPYGGGRFGFRQIYGSTISYDNVRVHDVVVPGN